MNKTKLLIKGSVLSGISFALRTFVSLFMTPFMITHLGNKSYGLWILVSSFSSFYGLLDFGLGSAVQRFLSRAIGKDDKDEANRVFNSSLIVFSGIGLSAFLAVLGIVFFAPHFVHTPHEIKIFRTAAFILGLSVAIGFPMRSFWGIYSSYLRYDVGIYIEIIMLLIKTGLFVYFLMIGKGVLVIALTVFSTDMAWHLFNAIFSLRIAPYLRFSSKFFSKDHVKRLFNYSIFAFISQISDRIKYDLDNFVVSAFVGLQAVTIYSVASRLISYFVQSLSSSIGLVTPVFSQYEGQGDYDAIREKFFFTTKISTFISVLIGGLLLLLGKDFIIRWVGGSFTYSYTILVVLTIPMVLNLSQSSSSQMLYGVSKHKVLAFINIAEAIVNLTLSIVLAHSLGALGVAWGTAIPMVIAKMVALPIYTSKVLGISLRQYYAPLFYNLAKGTVLMFALGLILRPYILPSYGSILLVGLAMTILYAVGVFMVGLSKSEKDLILKNIKFPRLNYVL
jgi:O-antigen/teichoic acid export membrane protein